MRATPVTGLFLFVAIILAVQASLASTEEGWWLELKYSSSRAGYDPRVWDWGGRTYYDFVMEPVFTAGLCIASSPVVADVDGDGADDIIFASCDGNTYALHGGDYNVLWATSTGMGLVSPAAIGDVDGDGVPEVVIGSRDFRLYVIDGVPYMSSATPSSTTTVSTTPATSSTTPPANETGTSTTTTRTGTGSLFTTGPSPPVWRPDIRLLTGLGAFLLVIVVIAIYGSRLRRR